MTNTNFDFTVILSRLQNGESSQNIADEMASLLNEAIRENEVIKQKEAEEKARIEEENAAREAKEKEANEYLEIIIDCINQYVALVYPEFIKYANDITTKDLEETIEQTFILLATSERVMKDIKSKVSTTKEKIANTKQKVKAKRLSDTETANILEDFLKGFGL